MRRLLSVEHALLGDDHAVAVRAAVHDGGAGRSRWRWGASKWGEIPTYAGMTAKGPPRLRENDDAPGDNWETGRSPVYGAIAPNGFLPTQE